MKNKIIIAVLILALIFAFLFLILRNRAGQSGLLDEFAQCLRDKGAIMYGAEWCPHCQNQKKLFGKSFQYINYAECPADPQKCLAADIESYPTWIIAGQERLVGEQKLETLSQKTNCVLSAEIK